MLITVLYFAAAREAVGAGSEELQLEEGATTASLLEALLAAHPGLASVMRSCVFAVNQEYVPPQSAAPLKSGDEVAIIPPLSGG